MMIWTGAIVLKKEPPDIGLVGGVLNMISQCLDVPVMAIL
jgi:hypothetical protein